MQGPSVLSGIALIRDWEISNDENNGHAGILQTCLGPMSNLFCVCVCYANVLPLSCTPSPRLFWCISSLVFSLSHGQQGEEFLVLEAHWQPLPPLSSPVIVTARYCPWVNWSLVGLNNSEEVTASILPDGEGRLDTGWRSQFERAELGLQPRCC